MTLADTEYSQALPADTRKALIRVRSGGYDVKLAYVSGESGTNYITIPAGATKVIEGVFLLNTTLYFQCPGAGEVLEIESWKNV